MTFHLNPPLTAKNGHTLEVIIVGRASDPGPGKQSILSLDDQESMHREWLKANTDLPFNVTQLQDHQATPTQLFRPSPANSAAILRRCTSYPNERPSANKRPFPRSSTY